MVMSFNISKLEMLCYFAILERMFLPLQQYQVHVTTSSLFFLPSYKCFDIPLFPPKQWVLKEFLVEKKSQVFVLAPVMALFRVYPKFSVFLQWFEISLFRLFDQWSVASVEVSPQIMACPRPLLEWIWAKLGHCYNLPTHEPMNSQAGIPTNYFSNPRNQEMLTLTG